MAEQATGSVESTGSAGTLAHGTPHTGHNPGRPVSWVAVGIVILGFIIGGIAFVPHPTWWAFWVGAGVAAIGIIMLALTNAVNEDWY